MRRLAALAAALAALAFATTPALAFYCEKCGGHSCCPYQAPTDHAAGHGFAR
jgi:hypothetical protein